MTNVVKLNWKSVQEAAFLLENTIKKEKALTSEEKSALYEVSNALFALANDTDSITLLEDY